MSRLLLESQWTPINHINQTSTITANIDVAVNCTGYGHLSAINSLYLCLWLCIIQSCVACLLFNLFTIVVNSVSWAPHEFGLMLACGSSDGTISILSSAGGYIITISAYTCRPSHISHRQYGCFRKPSWCIKPSIVKQVYARIQCIPGYFSLLYNTLYQRT